MPDAAVFWGLNIYFLSYFSVGLFVFYFLSDYKHFAFSLFETLYCRLFHAIMQDTSAHSLHGPTSALNGS